MKILMINSVCGIRSTGRICTDLAVELEKQGHIVKIAYGREDVPEQFKKYVIKIGNNFDIRIHGIKSRLLDAHGFGSKKSTEKFIQCVKKYDPDIIHIHNIHGYYLNIEVLFKYLKTCGKKIIWTLHDCWAFTGHCSHFDYIGCEKWKKECYSCPQINEYPKSVFIDRSRKNYREKMLLFTGIPNLEIVTPSNWLASVVKQSFLGEYPITVIHNGIDTSIFRPIESDFKICHGINGKKIILGVSSVWNDKKGFSDIIKLAGMLDDRYNIILVGVNDSQINKLPNNVIGIRHTNDINELCEIYTAADVFVNPSVEETMGLTTAEALACGTPVVVYNKTAVPEIPDSRSGIILEENTPEAMLKAILNINIDSSNCLARSKKFLKKDMFQKYMDLYFK